MKKLLLAFPIVALLAAGCNSSQQASMQTQTPAVQNTNPVPAPAMAPSDSPTNNYFVIQEWGVEFVKPSGIGDLQYQIGSNPNQSYATLTTKQLVDLDKSTGGKCPGYSIGTIGRFTTQQFNNLKNDKYGMGVPENVKVGDYYYSFSLPQEACSFNEQFKELEVIQTSALKGTVLKSLKATP